MKSKDYKYLQIIFTLFLTIEMLIIFYYHYLFTSYVSKSYTNFKFAKRIQLTCNKDAIERETFRFNANKFIHFIVNNYVDLNINIKNILIFFIITVFIYIVFTLYALNRTEFIEINEKPTLVNTLHIFIFIFVLINSIEYSFSNTLLKQYQNYLKDYNKHIDVLKTNIFVPRFLLQNEMNISNNLKQDSDRTIVNSHLVEFEKNIIKRILVVDQLESYNEARSKYIEIVQKSPGKIIEYIKFDMSSSDYSLLKTIIGERYCIKDDFMKLTKENRGTIYDYMCTYDSESNEKDFNIWKQKLIEIIQKFRNGIPIANYFKKLTLSDSKLWTIWSTLGDDNNSPDDNLFRVCISYANPLDLKPDIQLECIQAFAFLSSLNNGSDENSILQNTTKIYYQLFSMTALLFYVLFHIIYSLNPLILLFVLFVISISIVIIGGFLSRIM